MRAAVASGALIGVSADTLSDIFPASIDEIKSMSQKLLDDLNRQLESAKSADDLRFGGVFCDVAPKLALYSSYVKDFSNSITVGETGDA